MCICLSLQITSLRLGSLAYKYDFLLLGTIFSPLNLGPPSNTCRYCGAYFWYEERIDRRRATSSPSYNTCCRGGSVILPPYKPPPEVNHSMSAHFFDNIRYYNSMFAFTSMGVKIINSINDGRAPYVFKISGQLCHRIGSLLPKEGKRPEYAQLYIFDTENEIRNRIQVATYANRSFQPREQIVAALIEMFNTHNPIVQLFRTARDRLAQRSDDRYCIRLFGVPDKHSDVFSAPVASEVVGLVVGNFGASDVGRDLLVEDKVGQLHKVSEKHCKFMAMQYPILFPYGEDGYHENIAYRRCPRSAAIKRKYVTISEYFAYILHDRADDFNTPMRYKRGTHAYVIYGYCCMEESRLKQYRTESFQLKYRTAHIIEGSEAGQRIVLPSSYVGGPRYLYQNYLDCVALCRRYGCPDLFITFTSNLLWSEVTEALALVPGQHSSDRPDIIDRVFHMKLNLFMDDITKNMYFGPIVAGNFSFPSLFFPFSITLFILTYTMLAHCILFAVVYTIEFQKRGLPHVHLILWLDRSSPLTAEEVDIFISAQLPNPSNDPIGYEAVSKFMIHGPCSAANKSCPCMTSGECSSNYPKDFCEKTVVLPNGHVRYTRPKNGLAINKNGIAADNQYVVPHNVDLVVKYQAHINVERVNRDGMEKYLFKYFNKGSDFSKVGLQRRRTVGESSNQGVNEIHDYLECRTIAPNEAAWRLLQFQIHHTDPSVERLPVHLPFENNITFTEDDNLEQVLENPFSHVTKLTAWFEANKTYPQANQYTYVEFPEWFTWHGDGKYWAPRGGSNKIGRVAHVGPNKGEQYYLRMLLHIVKGARSYLDISIIEGYRYPTFQAACQALGLLGDDREWSSAMADAAHWALPYQLRELFVALLIFSTN